MAEKYYLCGPEGMIDTVATALKIGGLAMKPFPFELFTASAAADTNTAAETAASAKVIVVCDGLEHELKEITQGKTILDAALEQKLMCPIPAKEACAVVVLPE